MKAPKINEYDTTHLLVLQLLLTHILPLRAVSSLLHASSESVRCFFFEDVEGGSSTSSRKDEISK
jgi:hypothetical protein